MKPTPEASICRTYRLRKGTVALLDEASARLGIPASQLVDALLLHTLVQEAEGRLVVARRPSQWALERVYSAG